MSGSHVLGKWLKRLLWWAFIAFLLLQCWYLSCIVWWKFVDPSSTRFMRDRLHELRQANPQARLQRTWVDYERIAPAMKRAVIAAEDGRFMQHAGVDWDAVQRAYRHNVHGGKRIHGGSTITQQLAKNLFLSSHRSYWRKGQELLIAWMLELVLDKRRILEIYLNSVEWGNGVFGVEAAARRYYGVSAAGLSAYQAAQLASMLPAPRYFERNRGSGRLARKAVAVQARLGQVAVPR
ncbi:MAG: monofunctional biosynthetic peptidoglycan transglycosylase [Burkholderiaceae bacterium]|jgi:monofunctional biosynthetic peptidoglycan transglycosylase